MPGSPFYYDQILDSQDMTVRIYNNATASDLPSLSGSNLVLTGFFKDDFYMGIQNQWQTGGSSMIKMIVDTAASFINSRDVKMWESVGDAAMGMVEKAAGDSAIGRFASGARDLIHQAQGMSNSAIFSADDYFKSFKGSSVVFPTSMSVTLLSADRQHDIFDDLKKLLKVSIGELSTPEIAGFTGFVGVQAPPNGFESTFANIGQNIKGTLTVAFGNPNRGGYIVDNLVISNVNYVFSKAKVQLNSLKYRPLYIDVQVMFEPARMMSQKDVERILNS